MSVSHFAHITAAGRQRWPAATGVIDMTPTRFNLNDPRLVKRLLRSCKRLSARRGDCKLGMPWEVFMALVAFAGLGMKHESAPRWTAKVLTGYLRTLLRELGGEEPVLARILEAGLLPEDEDEEDDQDEDEDDDDDQDEDAEDLDDDNAEDEKALDLTCPWGTV